MRLALAVAMAVAGAACGPMQIKLEYTGRPLAASSSGRVAFGRVVDARTHRDRLAADAVVSEDSPSLPDLIEQILRESLLAAGWQVVEDSCQSTAPGAPGGRGGEPSERRRIHSAAASDQMRRVGLDSPGRRCEHGGRGGREPHALDDTAPLRLDARIGVAWAEKSFYRVQATLQVAVRLTATGGSERWSHLFGIVEAGSGTDVRRNLESAYKRALTKLSEETAGAFAADEFAGAASRQ